MTTADAKLQQKRIAEANNLLDKLGPINAEDLTRPFRQWAAGLHDIGETVEKVEVPASGSYDYDGPTNDLTDQLRVRVEALMDELTAPRTSSGGGNVRRDRQLVDDSGRPAHRSRRHSVCRMPAESLFDVGSFRTGTETQ